MFFYILSLILICKKIIKKVNMENENGIKWMIKMISCIWL